jgi:hypothetical protein
MSTREKILGSKMDASDAERQECVTLFICIPVLSAEDTGFNFVRDTSCLTVLCLVFLSQKKL